MASSDDIRRPASPVPLALAAAGVLALIILGAANADGAIWLIAGVLGLAAAITAWSGSSGRPQGPTLAAGIVGAVLALVVVLWGIFGD